MANVALHDRNHHDQMSDANDANDAEQDEPRRYHLWSFSQTVLTGYVVYRPDAETIVSI